MALLGGQISNLGQFVNPFRISQRCLFFPDPCLASCEVRPVFHFPEISFSLQTAALKTM